MEPHVCQGHRPRPSFFFSCFRGRVLFATQRAAPITLVQKKHVQCRGGSTSILAKKKKKQVSPLNIVVVLCSKTWSTPYRNPAIVTSRLRCMADGPVDRPFCALLGHVLHIGDKAQVLPRHLDRQKGLPRISTDSYIHLRLIVVGPNPDSASLHSILVWPLRGSQDPKGKNRPCRCPHSSDHKSSTALGSSIFDKREIVRLFLTNCQSMRQLKVMTRVARTVPSIRTAFLEIKWLILNLELLAGKK